MVHEHARDRGGVRVGVRREPREEDVLLDAEVLGAVLVPEREEVLPGVVGGRLGGAPEPLRGDERDVVVARQRLERGVALHRLDRGRPAATVRRT